MDLTPEEREQLAGYRQMMGDDAGNLALALDTLTDVLALVGQHTVYCRVEKGPRAGEAALDLVDVMAGLNRAKALVQQTLLSLRRSDAGP